MLNVEHIFIRYILKYTQIPSVEPPQNKSRISYGGIGEDVFSAETTPPATPDQT